MNIPNYDLDPTGEAYLMQKALKDLGFYKGALDNDFGTKSKEALAAWRLAVSIGDAEADVTAEAAGNFSPKALAMIEEFEGFDQPGKWPGAFSGVTIGIGYDLGYVSVARFREDWSPHLAEAVLDSLDDAVGVKGEEAKEMAPRYRDIEIDPKAARQVFLERTIPTFTARTFAAFPGIERLPLDAQGALVCLVFNRGESMKGDSRREMAKIRDLVAGDLPPALKLKLIAENIRSMKRLWDINRLRGLHRRRDAEAKLVEDSAQA